MKANQFIKEEDAVSPVIGVILMVAITVILAAVIGAFVFGMGTSLRRTYNVGASVSQSGNTITVVFNGGPDATEVATDGLAATIGGDPFDGDFTTNSTGAQATDNDGTAGHNDHVVVVATFKDDTQQVILDTYV
ncbi:MAG: type IV pilin N-terminal domain-containing protein [Halobacteriota archaeon]|nr:type IV pilin N-terminal domain-containing protein [Halobacteriota archaeon]